MCATAGCSALCYLQTGSDMVFFGVSINKIMHVKELSVAISCYDIIIFKPGFFGTVSIF